MNKMTHDEMLKYSAELVVKNNQDEAVKLLILLQQENESLKDIIKQAMNYCEEIINKEIDTSDSDFDLGQDFTARDILYILSSNKIN